MKRRAILALGSNEPDDRTIVMAMQRLSAEACLVAASPIAVTQAVGISSPPFHNAVVSLVTTASYPTLLRLTKRLEREGGDDRQHRKAGRIVLDIDILSYNGRRYHAEDWQRDYVKRLINAQKKRK